MVSSRKKPSQNDRVLAALRKTGTRGLSAVDFLPPRTVDGGEPILRLAARIHDLRKREFSIKKVGERHGTAVYVITQNPTSTTRLARKTTTREAA